MPCFSQLQTIKIRIFEVNTYSLVAAPSNNSKWRTEWRNYQGYTIHSFLTSKLIQDHGESCNFVECLFVF